MDRTSLRGVVLIANMSTERQSVFFMNISAGTLMDKGQELDRKFQSQSVNNPRDIIQAFEASPILNAKKSSEISTYDQDISTRDSSEGREPSRETFRCLKMLVAFTGLVSISALAVSVVILTGIVGSCKCSCQAEGNRDFRAVVDISEHEEPVPQAARLCMTQFYLLFTELTHCRLHLFFA